MADLGNLYFDILFRDKTAEQRKKLKAEITKDLQAKLDVGFDKKKLVGDMKTLLQSEKFKINVVVDKASTTQAVRAALQAAGLNTNFTASDLRAAKAAAIQTKAEASAAAARELARQRAARAAKAELDLANARERSANAARRHMTATLNMNGAMNSQLSIVGQLRNEFLGLYPIYATQNFLRAVVDIGGELENQKIAMASILQDEGKATTIFNQIKKLAVASPFGVMDLNQYAKQLSAYSIPYNELYDTMKRLADISAGVGVDMGRIILAFGQIKAAKFLKGTELRQLTEANIPMVDKLAERFSKLEGRIVSAGEVLDMISKKKVTFEDVKDVLWELTDDGGMFHNMQEVLSESVKSKWKNLADAIDIMLGDIAESMGSTLKWTAESLTTLAQNWKEVVPFITAATAAFGTYRVAVYAGSRAMGVANATLIKGTLAAKQKTAADLVMASNYRTLTAAEKGLIASRNAMTTAEWRALAVSGALNKEQALRLITLGKIKSGQAGHITQLLNISKAELQVAMSAGKARVAMTMLSYGAKQVWTAFKGLFNPYMYLFAGLFAITELWYKSGQKADEMNERISELTTRAQDGFKNLTKEAQKFADVDPFKANDASLISSIEKMKTALKDYSPVWADTFNETFKTDDEGNTVKSLAEQYILLRDALNDTKEAYRLLNAIRGTSEYANDATDGYFDESFSENIEDYIKAEKQIDKIIDRMAGSYIEYYTAMQKVIAKYDDFAKVASGKSLKEQLDIIKEYPKALASLNNELPFTGGYRDDLFQLRKAWKNSKRVFEEEVSSDMQSFISEYKSRLQAVGWNLDNLSDAQRIAIGLDISSFLDQFKEMPIDIRKFLNGEILEKQFNIKINAKYTETIQSLSDLQKKFNEATDGQFETQIKVSTDSEKIIEGIQKAYKEAKETTNQLKPILIKAGIDLSDIGTIDLSKIPDWQKQIVSDYKKAFDIMQAGEKGAKEIGFSLTDPSKDKSKKDAFAERLKERVNLLKEAYSEYKKWTDIVGKGEAANKVKGSGIFDSLFKGKEPVDISNYRDELNKILNQLDDKTKERRELKVSIRKVLLDIDANAMKEASDKAAKELERYVSDVSKKWDIYKQLINAGASKKDASLYAFGALSEYEKKSEELAEKVTKKMKDKGVYIPLTFTEQKATESLGGKDSVLYKQFFSAWKEAKDAIEKDSLEVKLKEVTALNKYKSIAEKIRDLSEKYAPLTGTFIGENNELIGNVEGMTPGQKALFTEYKEELAKLRGQLLELLPVWEQIFGDQTYKSYGQIQQASDYAQQIIDNASVTKNKNGKPTAFTSWYLDENGKRIDVSGEYSQIEKLKKAIQDLYKAGLQKNPFATLIKNVRSLFSSGDKDEKGTIEKIAAIGESAAESADLVGNFAGQMSSMFDALGNEGMADTMGNVQDAMSSISNIGQGFAKGGIVGGIAAAAGEAVNWIGKIAQAHDKKLDKAIEKSKLRAQQLQYIYEQIDGILERFLGSGTELKLVDAENDRTRLNQLNNQIEAIRNKGKINIFDLMSLQKYKQEAEKLQKRVSAYDEGGAYGYQRALMQEQLSELEKQRQAEIDKKKTDDSKVADYENQIAEMKQQIKDFAEETAESLYGINLKDWASQLGDALYEAWQKGEDGAEAFKNKVADIMGDVMNSILKISILEPAMQQLQKMLFGEDGMSGYFGKDFSLDERELESIADYLMGVSEKTDDYYSMLDKLNNYMEKKYGISMKEEEEENGSGLSKGIQNVTENTANLLASYINAIRADVSVKREYVRRLVEELFPAYNVIAQAQLRQLTMIQINTAKNVEFVEEIRDILHRNINGVNKFNV
ncbi:tape measure protein [Bacteroides uniformis]|uniref:Replicative DNA helicase n=1 Tax=Bacteroides uniformis TaxID=820 RepID=A0A7J5GIL6_BACUN|nr:tape measure protein [Bacteroides uniformis]KAB4091716.1 replicative DNA helicase [Bacteroides uniformis]KAB4095672.1 replicative DNA helicase [Bacteroides uniformis]KAB4102368.1 replicative DNA helicase [Bacteroides uniformis]KAB4104638.1 replicative DNA helicase [Bacteroides uniformis]